MPAHIQPLETPAEQARNKLKNRTIISSVVLMLLLIVLPITIFYARQQQEIRSKAAVLETVPITSFDAQTSDLDTYGVLNTADLAEIDRTKSSLVFINAVPITPGEGLQLIVENIDTRETVIDDSGIGGRQTIEHLLDPGNYSIEIKNFATEQTYYFELRLIQDREVNTIIRTDNGTTEGQFITEAMAFSEIPNVRLYNLTNDNGFGVFSGNLTNYAVFQTIRKNEYRDLVFSNPNLIIFQTGSAIPSLNNKLVNIINERRMKTLFFALGDETDANISAVLIPLPTVYKAPIPTQTNPHDATPSWCEGVYTCKLIDPNCSDCGKVCFATPGSCDITANGGSGTYWSGEKTVKPR